MIEIELVNLLLADDGVTHLVDDRIFPVVVKQDTALPGITYQRLSAERDYVLTGPSGWVRAVIGLTGWAREYSEARSLAEAIRVCLDGYDADTGIQIATVVDGADVYDADVEVFGCTLQITVQWEES